MRLAARSQRAKLRERRSEMSEAEAPRTLRRPISFVRFSAVNAARPKMPRQEMKIARKEKTAKIRPRRPPDQLQPPTLVQ